MGWVMMWELEEGGGATHTQSYISPFDFFSFVFERDVLLAREQRQRQRQENA